MSGFTLTCLDQDADRISVQSTHAPTWVPERRRYFFSRPRQYDVGVARDEVIILKTRAPNRIVIETSGELLIRSTRRGTVYLIPGRKRELALGEDETLIIRSPNATDPSRGHRPPTAEEIAQGFTP